MESGAIKHQQITAYSQYSENHGPENARLNHVADGRKMGAWSAKTNDLDQWLQVDFGRDVKITKFVTQGRQDYKQWVKSYTLSFSTEKEPVFQTYQENGQDKVTKYTLTRIKDEDSLQCRRISAGRVDIPIGCSGRHLELEKEW